MKVVKYKFATNVSAGTGESPEQVFFAVEMPWNETNEEIAKREAYNGEYIIEDDGVEEVSTPTQMDRLEAQLVYTAMMTDTLLEV